MVLSEKFSPAASELNNEEFFKLVLDGSNIFGYAAKIKETDNLGYKARVKTLESLRDVGHEKLIYEESGKISPTGRALAEYIMENEAPVILDLLLNADDKNPFTSKQRTELIHQYLRAVSQFIFPDAPGFSSAEIDSLTRSLRTRNLMRVSKIEHRYVKVGNKIEKRFVKGEWQPKYEQREDLSRYSRIFGKVRDVFVGKEPESLVETALSIHDSSLDESSNQVEEFGETEDEYTPEGAIIVNASPIAARYIEKHQVVSPDFRRDAENFAKRLPGKRKNTLSRLAKLAGIAIAGTTVLCMATGFVVDIQTGWFNMLTTLLGGEAAAAEAGHVDQQQMEDLYEQLTSTPDIDPSVTPSQDSVPEVVVAPAEEESQTSSSHPVEKPNGDQEVGEEERIDNLHALLKQMFLTNLEVIEKAILEKGELSEHDQAMLKGIAKTREKLMTQDKIIINLAMTDRYKYGTGDYAYFSEGQEHIGNSDGFVQIIISKSGINFVSFGRNLQVPTPILHNDGTITMGSATEIHYLGGALQNPDGSFMVNRSGQVVSGLDDGRQDAVFDTVTGNTEALLNIRMSLGLAKELANLAFSDGITLHFPNGFETKDIHHKPGDTVHLNGHKFLYYVRQRPIDSVNAGSFDRGVAFFRVFAADPTNFIRIGQALDLNAPFERLVNEDLGGEDGRMLMVGNTAEELVTWQALRMAMQDETFTRSMTALLLKWLKGSPDAMHAIKPVQDANGNFLGGQAAVEGYQEQTQDLMEQISEQDAALDEQ